jgi:hypothetical protein
MDADHPDLDRPLVGADDAGSVATAPDEPPIARRTGMSPDRTLIAHTRASIPAVDDAPTVARRMATGAAAVRGVGHANTREYGCEQNCECHFHLYFLSPLMFCRQVLRGARGIDLGSMGRKSEAPPEHETERARARDGWGPVCLI